MKTINTVLIICYSSITSAFSYETFSQTEEFKNWLNFELICSIATERKCNIFSKSLDDVVKDMNDFNQEDFSKKIEAAWDKVTAPDFNNEPILLDFTNKTLPKLSPKILESVPDIENEVNQLKELFSNMHQEIVDVKKLYADHKQNLALIGLELAHNLHSEPWEVTFGGSYFDLIKKNNLKELSRHIENIISIQKLYEENGFNFTEFTNLIKRSYYSWNIVLDDKSYSFNGLGGNDAYKIISAIKIKLLWQKFFKDNEMLTPKAFNLNFGYSLNFLWIGREQELKIKNEYLENILAWCDKIRSDSIINIWHDALDTDDVEKILSEKKMNKCPVNPINLRRVHDIKLVKSQIGKGIFHYKSVLPIYFVIDLLKQMIAEELHEEFKNGISARYMIFSDLNVPPNHEKYLFSDNAIDLLDKYGWLVSDLSGKLHTPDIKLSVMNENAFFIFDLQNEKTMQANREALIDANLARAQTYINLKQEERNKYTNFPQIVYLSYESMNCYLHYLLGLGTLKKFNNNFNELFYTDNKSLLNRSSRDINSSYNRANFSVEPNNEEKSCRWFPVINVGKPKTRHSIRKD